MIYILGDIHGNHEILERLSAMVQPDDTVIQVGDFGIYGAELFRLGGKYFHGFPCKVYVIDGNHEDFNIINTWSKDEPTEFAPNFFYMPRGYVTEIEGELFGFLGGAESVDKAWRVQEGPSRSWYFEERITDSDIDRLMKNLNGRAPDVLITHSPPQFVNAANFPPLREQDWNLPLGWIDESAWKVSKVYWAVKPKKMYCGHMHKSVLHDNVRIVDINEVLPHKIDVLQE
jgi:hypothetical protein